MNKGKTVIQMDLLLLIDINRSKSFDRKLYSVLSELTVGRDKACLVSTARTYGMINSRIARYF